MGKKQTQFRFEEDFISDLSRVADEQGITMSELVRNALRLYISLYGRMKGKTVGYFWRLKKMAKRGVR